MIPANPGMVDRPHYVYRHYDAASELLYVGCTSVIAIPAYRSHTRHRTRKAGTRRRSR